MLQPRIKLVPVSQEVLSSYQLTATGRGELKKLGTLPMGLLTPDTAVAVQRLDTFLSTRGVDFRVTDGNRPVALQAQERAKYDAWLAAGRPEVFDRKRMRSVFVAKPGYSMHNAGRAIDINLEVLRFPGVPKDKQLDTLWDFALPLHLRPAIRRPVEGQDESWHFDFFGPWEAFYERTHNYAMTAMCACLDVGIGGYSTPEGDERLCLQAQLQRAGFDCGPVDGIIGARTSAALSDAGFSTSERDYTKLFSLPSRIDLIFP